MCVRPASKRAPNPDKNKYALANTYYQHYDENNPAYKLKQYIELMEAEIKEKYKVEEVTKKIIIDEQDEKVDL